MNVSRAFGLVIVLAAVACSDSDEEPAAVASLDACAMLPSATVAEKLDVSAPIEAGPDNGTFLGELVGTCGYTWGDGTHRLSFTIERDDDNRYMQRFRTRGIPLTTPVSGVGEAAFVRADGALVWTFDDERMYVLLGQLGSPMTPVPHEKLVAIATSIRRP